MIHTTIKIIRKVSSQKKKQIQITRKNVCTSKDKTGDNEKKLPCFFRRAILCV